MFVLCIAAAPLNDAILNHLANDWMRSKYKQAVIAAREHFDGDASSRGFEDTRCASNSFSQCQELRERLSQSDRYTVRCNPGSLDFHPDQTHRFLGFPVDVLSEGLVSDRQQLRHRAAKRRPAQLLDWLVSKSAACLAATITNLCYNNPSILRNNFSCICFLGQRRTWIGPGVSQVVHHFGSASPRPSWPFSALG